MAKSKTASKEASKCPVSKEQFMKESKGLVIKVGDESKVAAPKEFATGSFGYYTNEKVTLMVGDIPVKFQANINLVAVGSKPQE